MGRWLRISFHDESGDQQWAASVCDRYPTGTVVDVFYDPSRPERAVLQPGFKLRGGVIVPFVFGIVFAGLAFAGPLPKMLRALKRSRR